MTIQMYGQNWHRIYFPTKESGILSVYESYDRGFVMSGEFRMNSVTKSGFVLKTDINGYTRWFKTVTSGWDINAVTDINETHNGGMILTGITNALAPDVNPFVIKLNACGEKEWCRIYVNNMPYQEWGQSVLPFGAGYLALMHFYGNPSNERIWLFRLDEQGELIWKQVYAQSDSLIDGEDANKMIISSDNQFIINGQCYYPDPNNPSMGYLRPFIIKTDTSGSLLWELPWWQINSESYRGQTIRSIIDNSGTIYTSGRHIVYFGSNPGDKPVMIKTDKNGNEISYHDLAPSSLMGTTATINWLADSTLVLSACWSNTLSGSADLYALKIDRAGIVLDSIQLPTNDYCLTDGQTTFNNKLLLVGGLNDSVFLRSNAFKFNSNLDYDSVYVRPFTYDSLCPYAIPSDTITMDDCQGVIVGLNSPGEEMESHGLRIYPNPVAGNEVTIGIPDILVRQSQGTLFNITTTYHQWHNARLEILDLNGRMMFESKIGSTDQEVQITVSSWPSGIYFVRLIYMNESMITGKLIVHR